MATSTFIHRVAGSLVVAAEREERRAQRLCELEQQFAEIEEDERASRRFELGPYEFYVALGFRLKQSFGLDNDEAHALLFPESVEADKPTLREAASELQRVEEARSDIAATYAEQKGWLRAYDTRFGTAAPLGLQTATLKTRQRAPKRAPDSAPGIVVWVAAAYGVPPWEVMKRRPGRRPDICDRDRRIVHARQNIALQLEERLGLSTSDIGPYLGIESRQGARDLIREAQARRAIQDEKYEREVFDPDEAARRMSASIAEADSKYYSSSP